MVRYFVVFFKHNTAYESRISDWSSYLFSSYLDFGQGQRGAFARGEQRRFAPDGDMVQPQFGFAVDLGLLDVHVQAEGAAVHLGRADLQQAVDLVVDRAAVQGGAELHEFLEELGGLLDIVQALAHFSLLNYG